MSDPSPHVVIFGMTTAAASGFSQQALEWSAFFSSVAQVSGGLVGLVFIALTFNGKLGAGGDSGLRDLARQTFADFLNVLIVSLSFLAPRISADNIALFTIICGSLGIFRIVRALMRIWRSRRSKNGPKNLIRRFLLSLSGNLGLLVAGVMLLQTTFYAQAFWSTVMGSVFGLLISGSRSAWTLVVPEHHDTTAR